MILLNLPLLHHLFPQKSCSNLVFVQVIMNWITCLAFLIKQLMVSVVLSWKFLGHGQWVSFSVLGGQEILEKKGTFQLFAYCLLCWKYARTVSKLFFNYYSLEFQGLSVENLIERICFHWMKKYWGAGETGKKKNKAPKTSQPLFGLLPPPGRGNTENIRICGGSPGSTSCWGRLSSGIWTDHCRICPSSITGHTW